VIVVPMHGLGGARDLPIPASLAISAAVAALVISFTVLIVAWRTPRYDARTQGRPVPDGFARFVDGAPLRWTLRVLGLAVFVYLGWALLAGPDVVTNPVFGSFYVLLWVGIVPFSLLFGPIFRAVSPMRTVNLLLARGTGGDPARGVTGYPPWLGYWPAAVGLFGFVWQELVNESSTFLGTVRLWLALYVGAMLVGSALFGSTWFKRADPFEVYSTLVAHLSPWGRDRAGRLVLRSPLANLDGLRGRPGLVATVAVLFGSTAFDSYKDTVRWVSFVQAHTHHTELFNTAALLAFCAVIGVTFTLAAMTTGVDRTHPEASDRASLPALLAPSVVPIIVGYMTAHYLSYFVEQGQITVLQLSDPMVDGANLLGTANWPVTYWLSYHVTVLATVKVLAVVLGHIVGVVAAHDRALKLLPPRHQVAGQLGMLAVMVCYTGAGLYLLFGS
jgi:hypothetical protein